MKNKLTIKLTGLVLCAFLLASFSLTALPAQRSASGESAGAALAAGEIKNVTANYKNAENNALALDGGAAFRNEYSGNRRVVIELDDNPLIDYYNNAASERFESVAEYFRSDEAADISTRLDSLQDSFIKDLKKSRISFELNYRYNAVLNGISITLEDGKDISAIESMKGVKSVIISESYDIPATDEVNNKVNVYTTGIYNSSDISYRGDGMLVAVLDTGLDYSHNAFQRTPPAAALTRAEVEQKLSASAAKASYDASSSLRNLQTDNVYLSSKVPFAYDYADNDSDVFPTSSSHGTHVAGIIAGYDASPTAPKEIPGVFENGAIFRGVAPNAQLAIFKVFSDSTEGADSDVILAAINDAVLIGVDVINMSLGRGAGNTRESDAEATNAVYDKVNAAGINLVIAAGNEGSSGQGGPYGLNLMSNPDSGTVGSPSTYAAAISVASISGQLSPYILANDTNAVYIGDGSNLSGEKYNFVDELLSGRESAEYDYVTIGGYGESINYTGKIREKLADGKTIALVSRGGGITFEAKQATAAEFGAIGCIIYNNVSGTLNISLGTGKKIPTCIATMEEGKIMAARNTGKVRLAKDQKAGPFMSDFSGWGPTPDLKIKPEITAHGGDIVSAVVGGYGVYSGTSMASPNMAGAVTLLRQHVKKSFPDLGLVHQAELVNTLLMSTATIAYNERNNPYSPRRQGSGIADIFKAINTGAYLRVPGLDKVKLELGDDSAKRGYYDLEFNVKNISGSDQIYDIKTMLMTESVSSDGLTVAGTPYMLSPAGLSLAAGAGASLSGSRLTVTAGADAKVNVRFSLSTADRAYLDQNFINGMYVEGFVELAAIGETSIDLSIPFLSFYGDWTNAPMFDISNFELYADQNDPSIAPEDKRISLTWPSVPVGGVYRSTPDMMMYLGEYVYRKPEDGSFREVPVLADKVAIGADDYGIYSLKYLYAGMLRGAKEMDITVTNTITGEQIMNKTEYNVRKSYSQSTRGTAPSAIEIEIDPYALNLKNNEKYTVDLKGRLDYENGENVPSNSFAFDFYVDYEAPTLRGYTMRSEYDRNGKRTVYLDLELYDNNYVQAVQLFQVVSSSGLAMLTDYPIPVYGDRASNDKISIDVTSYMNNFSASYYKDTIGIYLSDYALNTTYYIVDVDFADITSLAIEDESGEAITSRSLNVGEALSLAPKIMPADADIADINYSFSTSGIVEIRDNKLKALAAGTVIVTVAAKSDPNIKTSFTITVTGGGQAPIYPAKSAAISSYTYGAGTSSEFSRYISGTSLWLDCGTTVTLGLSTDPWYASLTNVTWTSSDPETAAIDPITGLLTCLKQTVALTPVYITAEIENSDGQKLSPFVALTIGEEYKIMSGYFYEYYGTGVSTGESDTLVIPANLGIRIIGDYSTSGNGPFYGNSSIKKVIVPEGVTQIGRGSFANSSIEEIYLPSTLESIGTSAFDGCKNLKKIYWIKEAVYNDETKTYDKLEFGSSATNRNLTIGAYAFSGTFALESFDFSKVNAIYYRAFYNSDYLSDGSVLSGVLDLRNLRFCGDEVFAYNKKITGVLLSQKTALGAGTFNSCSGLTSVEFYGNFIPNKLFENCKNLKSVIIHSDLSYIGNDAFRGCSSLTGVDFRGTVSEIRYRAFADCIALYRFTLPEGISYLGSYAFSGCKALVEMTISRTANITTLGELPFDGCLALTSFLLATESHMIYSTEQVVSGGKTYHMLLNKDKTAIVFIPLALDAAATGILPASLSPSVKEIGTSAYSGKIIGNTLIIPDQIEHIGAYAFSYNNFKTVVLPSSLKTIGAYAFADCPNLERVVFKSDIKIIPEGLFFNCSSLKECNLPNSVTIISGLSFYNCSALESFPMPAELLMIGAYAFRNAGLRSLDFASNSQLQVIDQAAFYMCMLEEAHIPEGVWHIGAYAFFGTPITRASIPSTLESMGMCAFANCFVLEQFVAADGALVIGDYCFALFDGLTPDNATGVYYNDNLKDIRLPSSIEYIGGYAFIANSVMTEIDLSGVYIINAGAFMGCVNLQKVILSEKCIYIGASAFSDAYRLTSIDLSKVVYIGSYAFLSTLLQSVNLDSALYIYPYAFADCMQLTSLTMSSAIMIGSAFIAYSPVQSLTIPSSVYFMAEGALLYNSLASLTVDAGNADFFAENNILYRILPGGSYEAFAYAAAASASEIRIKENTVRIASYAFAFCDNITRVIFPTSLKSIGHRAFYCTGYVYDTTSSSEFRETSVTYVFTGYQAPIFEGGYIGANEIYNLYSNLGFYLGGEVMGQTIRGAVSEVVTPSNGSGYDNYIFQSYTKGSGDGAEALTPNTQYIIDSIAALPSNVSGKDSAEVARLRAMYDELNDEQRNHVFNISELIAAEQKLAADSGTPDVPDTPETPPEDDAWKSTALAVLSIMCIILMLLAICGWMMSFLRIKKEGEKHE